VAPPELDAHVSWFWSQHPEQQSVESSQDCPRSAQQTLFMHTPGLQQDAVLVHDDCSVAHRVVLVVVVPGVVVVVVPLAIGTHVHFAQKAAGPQPLPSHCSPRFGSVTPSPHTDGAPRSTSWLRPTTRVPVSCEQAAVIVARKRARPEALPQAPLGHAARRLVAWRVALMCALVGGQTPAMATRPLSMATIARPPATGRSWTGATKSPAHAWAFPG
jgi:hypothetical protein